MNPESYEYEYEGAGDPTAVPAALGLGLLAVGGWLLTTTRPWDKPGHPLTLALGWTVSGALLVCGLLLLARCVRAVHGHPDPPLDPRPDAATDTGTEG
ncbi:hypothetical protein ACIQZO_06820 [Streptomyces sp. NPDC097617]|uniref:hypothetical protein n=1 Tax=Streptomyces sp. NPDC097617 TaxID=3366091 RepID=UPI00381A932F